MVINPSANFYRILFLNNFIVNSLGPNLWVWVCYAASEYSSAKSRVNKIVKNIYLVQQYLNSKTVFFWGIQTVNWFSISTLKLIFFEEYKRLFGSVSQLQNCYFWRSTNVYLVQYLNSKSAIFGGVQTFIWFSISTLKQLFWRSTNVYLVQYLNSKTAFFGGVQTFIWFSISTLKHTFCW